MSDKRRDLYLVTSLTELMTVAAILAERGEQAAGPAILHGQATALPAALCDAFLDQAGLFGDWNGVHVARAPEGAEPRSSADAVATTIRQIIGDAAPDRIFIHALHKPLERGLLNAFPGAAIHMFDNGLASHVVHPVLAPKPDRTKARWIDRRHLRRVTEAWYSIRGELAAPAHVPPHLVRDISATALRAAAGRAANAIGRSPEGSTRRDIIIGTAFYRTSRIDHADERAAHLALVAELAEAGGPRPYFKPHPRTADQPILTEADGVEIIDSELPVEAWAEARPLARAFSLSSTALLTLRRLYGLEVWRFGGETMTAVAKGLPHIRLLEAAIPEWRSAPARRPKVIGIGLAKTGTKTLNACFARLGYKRRTAFQPAALKAFVETGSTQEAEAILADRDTCVDWPWPLMFERLDAAFPGSKFVLTRRRDARTWVDSVCAQAVRKPDSPYRRLAYGVDDPAAHRDELIQFYESHLARVRAHFAHRPDDLIELCWEEGDGWDRLAAFLGKPVPEDAFPHENRTPDSVRADVRAQIRETVSGGRKSGRYSVVQGLDRAKRGDAPFAHSVIDNCLPGKVYKALRDSFPIDRLDPKIAGADNKRHDLFASWGKSRHAPETAPDPWRAFMKQNSRVEVARAVWSHFEDEIAAAGDRLYERIENPADLRVRVTIGVNTPARRKGTVRGAHCDNRTKAFVGLFYLRDPAEGEVGGDLIFYRWKAGAERRRAWPSAVESGEVEEAARIPYAANRLVLFPNFDNALHGVSARLPAQHGRRLVVISGWFPSHADDERTRASLAIGAGGEADRD